MQLSCAIGILTVCAVAGACASRAPNSAATQNVPAGAIPVFAFDPTWPKLPLPNNWIIGNIGGVHVDDKDQIWVSHRANTVPVANQPGTPAPAVLVFNTAGALVKAWGGPDPKNPKSLKTPEGYEWPREHGLFVDHKGHVWLGCDGGINDAISSPDNCGSVTKLTSDGRLIWQKGKRGQTTGNADTENFNSPTDIFVDAATNEAFIADGYRNKRIAVIDAETGAFKRMWGPYGTPNPPDIPRTRLNGNISGMHDPALMKVFGDAVHCIALSRDGLVYVCDRGNNRIQVFRRDGTFVTEAFVAPETRRMGSVFDIGFSPDSGQRFVYVADGANSQVHILRRDTLKEIGTFGGGDAAALATAHVLATDSTGNVYVGEVGGPGRIMRWTYTGMRNP